MSGLTAKQRQLALREVDRLANELGMPEAVYVAEHGVTILANEITARRWSGFGNTLVLPGDVLVPLIVTACKPLVVAS